jgi:hypothetical protein
VAPEVTATNSQPSRPKLLRIACVLWINTGAVRYSHCVTAGALMTGDCIQRLTPFGRPVGLLARNLKG